MREVPKTPRGQEYTDNFSEVVGKKLYNARNTEVAPNLEPFKIAHELDEALREFPAYVGVVPYGSTMHGYSDAASDVDIAVFVDHEIESRSLYNKASEIAQKYGQHVRVATYDLDRFTMANIVHQRDGIGRVALALFCGRVIGPKVSEYRAMIAELIRQLPAEKRGDFIKLLSLNAAIYDLYGGYKASERISSLEGKSEKELQKLYLEKRQPMWEKRIRNVFEL